MPSVILVSKTGAEFPVSSPAGFIEAVYGRGALPKVGTVEDNLETLGGGAAPTGPSLGGGSSLKGQTRATLARFHRRLAENPATVKIVIVGDSTAEETNYAITYSRLRDWHTKPGQALAGMTPANIIEGGNSGLTLQAWLGDSAGDFRPSHLAALTDVGLIIPRFLINDTRLGARTQTQMAANLRSMVDLMTAQHPTADILLPVPNSLTTTVVGQDYLGGATQAQAQARNDAMRGAVLSLRDDYPHVLVVDAQADLWGTRVLASSPLMGDQLHPNQTGQRRWADYIAQRISEWDRLATVAPDAYRYNSGRLLVSAAGNGYLDVGRWDGTTGPLGREMPFTTNDILYSLSDPTLAPIPLTGATFSTSGEHTRILKAGDWTAYAGTGASAVVVGDHPAEGVRGGRVIVTGVDPASIAAGATVDQTFTVTGARSGMGVVCAAPGMAAGLMIGQAWVTATDQVTVRMHNTTASAIDPASATWTFWLAR